MEKEYPVIEVPSDGKPNWSEGSRCMVFVYSKNNGNFILKGYLREVKKYLKENYSHYFFYLSMWHDGKSRGYWNFWKKDVTIFEPDKSKKRKIINKKFRVIKFNMDDYPSKKEIEIDFKRLPKRWIPEFDKL